MQLTNDTNMTNANASGSQPFVLPPDVQIGVTLFAVLIFVTALIGNTIVVHIVCSCNHMRNTTNILIANMAVADLWMTFDIPYVVKWLYVADSWFGGAFGEFLCKFCHSAQAGSIACSVFTLVCISLDRSFAILFPMKKMLTTRIVKILIVIIWLMTSGFVIPLFITTRVIESPDGTFHCRETGWLDLEATSEHKYITAYTLCTYVLPLAIICTMYILTGLRLWSRKIPGHRSLRVHKSIQSSNKRATIMLITVVAVFALCWFPFQIRELLLVYDPSMQVKIPLRLIVLLPWFGFANSAVNPILYVLFSENYRREFKRTFSRMDRRRSSTSLVSRGTTLRTRMSVSTASVPLQKLRNGSCAQVDGSNELLTERSRQRSRGSSNESPTRFLEVLPIPADSPCGSPESETSEPITSPLASVSCQ